MPPRSVRRTPNWPRTAASMEREKAALETENKKLKLDLAALQPPDYDAIKNVLGELCLSDVSEGMPPTRRVSPGTLKSYVDGTTDVTVTTMDAITSWYRDWTSGKCKAKTMINEKMMRIIRRTKISMKRQKKTIDQQGWIDLMNASPIRTVPIRSTPLSNPHHSPILYDPEPLLLKCLIARVLNSSFKRCSTRRTRSSGDSTLKDGSCVKRTGCTR